ncbi:hypothetical protein FJZ55_05245 [Candidatus Woesearchaeota archaeon]|nr:hypothetical protein [Candidatus Woesearchaeota archaeon]
MAKKGNYPHKDKCGQSLTVRDDASGKRLKCPDCPRLITVPTVQVTSSRHGRSSHTESVRSRKAKSVAPFAITDPSTFVKAIALFLVVIAIIFGMMYVPSLFRNGSDRSHPDVVDNQSPGNPNDDNLDSPSVPPSTNQIPQTPSTSTGISSTNQPPSGNSNFETNGGAKGEKREIKSPGEWVKNDTSLMEGDELLAVYDQAWYSVKIVEVKNNGTVKIHWNGWSDRWDEVRSKTTLRFAK